MLVLSIVESLKRLFDPATYHYEQGEKHSDRARPIKSEDGGPPKFEVPQRASAQSAPVRFRCRLCPHEGEHGDFCPSCLAETMVPAEPEDGAK